MEEEKNRSKGVKRYREILRPKEDEDPEKAVTGIRELTLDHLFAHVWCRGGLQERERRLVSIALLAAQGHENQLKKHVKGALLSNVPIGVLHELMIHVAHYAGWASGTSGHSIVETASDEIETDKRENHE